MEYSTNGAGGTYKYLLRVTLLDFQLILDTKKVSLFYYDFAILLEDFSVTPSLLFLVRMNSCFFSNTRVPVHKLFLAQALALL